MAIDSASEKILKDIKSLLIAGDKDRICILYMLLYLIKY